MKNSNSLAHGDGITTPRKYDWQRVGLFLLRVESETSLQIEREVGVRSAPFQVSVLRKKGIRVNTASEHYQRGDGSHSQIARYSIADGCQSRARLLLGVTNG